MTSRSSRQSPLSRTSTRAYPLEHIEQGLFCLQVLGALRFATNSQMERAVFARLTTSKHQARHQASRTMRRLFDAGFINRTPVLAPTTGKSLPSRQLVSSLSAAGCAAIGLDPAIMRRRTPRAGDILYHDYWLVEVGAQAIGGCPEGLRVVSWWDDRVLRSRKRKGQFRMSGIPDAYLLTENIETGKLFPTFVELDLGTESVVGATATRLSITSKVESYRHYIYHRFGEDFGMEFPPVILWLAHSQRRCDSLHQAAVAAGAHGRFWFSTLGLARGITTRKDDGESHSKAPQGPFWTSIWKTGHHDEVRSLANRCGVSGE